jgi:hypothetical protein
MNKIKSINDMQHLMETLGAKKETHGWAQASSTKRSKRQAASLNLNTIK